MWIVFLTSPAHRLLKMTLLFGILKTQAPFSVKSAYHVGFSLLDSSLASSSGLGESESWWKFLWQMRLSSKVKVFLWKACKEWLPVRANLVRRHLNVERWCPFCLNKEETIIHGLWKCPLLKRIRAFFVNFRNLAVSEDMKFLDFIISCKNNGSAADLDLLCVVLWRV